MDSHNTNNSQNTVTSEIARFLQQWDDEVEAIKRGMNGFALTARHEFITKRMQSFGDESIAEMMRLETEKMQLKAKEKARNAIIGEGENELV